MVDQHLPVAVAATLDHPRGPPLPGHSRRPVHTANFVLYRSQASRLSGCRMVRRWFFRPSVSCTREGHKAMYCQNVGSS
jgi:hypothetical protein